MKEAFCIQDVTKIYSSGEAAVLALDRVSVSAEVGELVTLMGPSGSGKTTLLFIAGCILKPTSGRVWVGGCEVTRLKESDLPPVRLRQIGFIFQGFNLFPTLSAGENVELTLNLRGVRGRMAKRSSRELLESLGLGDKYDTFPRDLSGGQKQRVAIARAFAGEPEIILADEPTAALDSHSGQIVMTMLREMAHKWGRAVVVVTHDTRVLDYADRVVYMRDGKVSESTKLGNFQSARPPRESIVEHLAADSLIKTDHLM